MLTLEEIGKQLHSLAHEILDLADPPQPRTRLSYEDELIKLCEKFIDEHPTSKTARIVIGRKEQEELRTEDSPYNSSCDTFMFPNGVVGVFVPSSQDSELKMVPNNSGFKKDKPTC